jgi:hypothetical protein
MSFMLSHVCRRGELKGYSPPPGGFIVGPELCYERRDQHYQRTHRRHSGHSPYDPKAGGPRYTGLVVRPAARQRGGPPPMPSVSSGPKSGINNLSFAA